MEYILIHHGILGQKWGIRRFQNYDGTRIGAKKRGPTVKDYSSSDKKKPSYYGNRPIKDFWKSDENSSSSKKFWDANAKNDAEKMKEAAEELRNEGKKAINEMSNEELNTYIKELSNEELTNQSERIKLENNFRNLVKTADDIVSEEASKAAQEEKANLKTVGNKTFSKMSDEEIKRYLSGLTDEQLKAVNTRISTENKIKNSTKSADDIIKEEKQKKFNESQATLGDAQNIAKNTANLATGMKNLNSNKSSKSYINPKKVSKMSDDELRAATARAQLENNYLSASNQTVEKGKNAIDWDKIATIAGIAATTISIASSVNAIRNRRND